jgi:hypothetical protein
MPEPEPVRAQRTSAKHQLRRQLKDDADVAPNGQRCISSQFFDTLRDAGSAPRYRGKAVPSTRTTNVSAMESLLISSRTPAVKRPVVTKSRV